MSFQEDFSEFLDIDGGFASNIEVIPPEGEPYLVTGIFSKEYADIDDGFAPVGGSNPCFECAADKIEDISYDHMIKHKDCFYRVKIIKPDGYGWMNLILEEQ